MTDARDFLLAYCDAWNRVLARETGIESLTPFFHDPYVSIGKDGDFALREGAEAIAAFNQTRLDAFGGGGAVSAAFRGIDTATQGPHLAQVNANWELMRADGSLERAWRHHYTLRCCDSGWKILVSTFQTGC